MRLAGIDGRVLIGHAHNAGYSHGVAGNLLAPQGYAALFPGCMTFDAAAFTTAFLTGTPARSEHPTGLDGVEAVSLAWYAGDDIQCGPPDSFATPVEGTQLVLNPLLENVGGRLEPHWPSPQFAEEYRSAEFLSGELMPSPEVLHAAASGLIGRSTQEPSGALDVWHEVRRLARKRILLPKADCL